MKLTTPTQDPNTRTQIQDEIDFLERTSSHPHGYNIHPQDFYFDTEIGRLCAAEIKGISLFQDKEIALAFLTSLLKRSVKDEYFKAILATDFSHYIEEHITHDNFEFYESNNAIHSKLDCEEVEINRLHKYHIGFIKALLRYCTT